MTGTHGRRIDHGQSRKDRVATAEINPLITHPCESRRGLVINRARSQAVRNEENDVVWQSYLRYGRARECSGAYHKDQKNRPKLVHPYQRWRKAHLLLLIAFCGRMGVVADALFTHKSKVNELQAREDYVK